MPQNQGQAPLPLIAVMVGKAVPDATVTLAVAGETVLLVEPMHIALLLAPVPPPVNVTLKVQVPATVEQE
jgi:hypothetical protein